MPSQARSSVAWSAIAILLSLASSLFFAHGRPGVGWIGVAAAFCSLLRAALHLVRSRVRD
jgi:hypothetical protein